MSSNPQGFTAESNDIKDVISNYTKHWKWFIVSVIAFIILAFVYLRYTIPEYEARAKIQIIEDQNSASGLDLFSELDLFGSKNKVEDEIEIINSRSNVIEVVRELGLNTKVKLMGNILDTELYANPPLKLIL